MPDSDKSAKAEEPPSCQALIENKTTFKEKYYPTIKPQQWNDWKWQVKNSITTYDGLKNFTQLTQDEEDFFKQSFENLPFRITPYYLGVILDSPLRKTMIPLVQECQTSSCEKEDPLNEDKMSPVPGIVHRYPDRVLFLVSNICAAYCRYCTRSRIFNHHPIDDNYYEKALDYIRNHTEVRDVLISGGDALLLSNEKIDWILNEIKQIKHVEIIRIGTKAPVVLPQRINKKLIDILKKYKPLWINIHFTHPDELTEETQKACRLLSDSGIPLGSQTVLLKDINNNSETMKKLVQGLVKSLVRPVYIYQCDPILGSGHFRTKVQEGIDIIRSLRGHTTGFAVPTFVIDAPNGHGKIPISPEYYKGTDENGLTTLINYQGKECYYQE